MSIYNEPSPTKEVSSESLIRNKDSKLYHVFNFLAEEYGNNTEKVLARLNGVLALGLATEFIKNKKLRTVVKTLQTGISAAVFGTEFVMHVKNYMEKRKKDTDNPYAKRMGRVSKLLGIPKESPFYCNVPYASNWMDMDVVKWFLKNPPTSRVAVKKYYNMANLDEIEDVDMTKTGEIGILLEYDGRKVLWDITIRMIMDEPILDNSHILSEGLNDNFSEKIYNAILYDYVQSLDIKHNIIKFGGGGIITRPRRSVPEKINQFDVDRVIEEMREVLKHGRKRAFAFVGRQGVGKSSILRLIEERMDDYMVLHLTPDDFENAHRIISRFEVAKMFQPLIIVIEDLDSCGLKTKNAKTGAFLDCIDDVNRDLHAIILVSINDTGMVHQTIINRPGRFDRVFEVMPPSSIQEAYEVILSKSMSLAKDYCPGTAFSLPDSPTEHMTKNLQRCLDCRFTQAELTSAVTEQVFIDLNIEINHNGVRWETVDTDLFDKSFEKAIDKHLATKRAIKEFKFNNELGDTNEDWPAEEVKCAGTPAAVQTGQPYSKDSYPPGPGCIALAS